jgi:pimeloyl-ACP methyl ester carboxylesterase
MRYIYCHPLFDERKCAHRFSYQLKKAFEEKDARLEQFDYHGTGEATGQFTDVSLESLRNDIAQFIAGQQVSLIGTRFGASLAFDYCTNRPNKVNNLILLEPVMYGAEYIDYLHRKQHVKNLMTSESEHRPQDDGYTNLEGYKTSNRFIEQIKKFSLFGIAAKCSVKNYVFVIYITNRSKVDPQIAGLTKLLQASAIRVQTAGMNLPPFWERIPSADYTELTQKIVGWCCD